MRLHPFRALRPRPELAARVASVPYDVVDRDEAAALAEGNPLSFLHVVRAEIDLPADVDPYSDEVYRRARTNLDAMRADGVLQLDREPALFAYRLRRGEHVQTAIVGGVHIDDYERDLVKKHERTRPAKENDRVRHILELGANPELVLLCHRRQAEVARVLDAATATPPLYDFTADDGIHHTMWRIPAVDAAVAAFAAVPECYVADGHHRCAAAWRAGSELRAEDAVHSGEEGYHWFPAALFPADELCILPYHRVVTDLGDLTSEQLLSRLAEVGTLASTDHPQPPHAGSFGFYLEGRWHRLTLDASTIDRADPVASLDAELLQRRVLTPILGIEDPRTDPRLEFVGGIRGTAELKRRVDSGVAMLAIAMTATTCEQMMHVADAGQVMPPKSTWFEPKLRSGLLVHLLAAAGTTP